MLSCPERESIRRETLACLSSTDWNGATYVEIDQHTCERKQTRQEQTALRLLQKALGSGADLILFLEDDIIFNQHVRHNLEHWAPLWRMPETRHFFASLYNPNVRPLAIHRDDAFFIADPNAVYGSQAFLLSIETARHIVAHWTEVSGMQDIKMSRLAARVSPIYYHQPSLVQHVGKTSVWGGHYHHAMDFDVQWKAPVTKRMMSYAVQ